MKTILILFLAMTTFGLLAGVSKEDCSTTDIRETNPKIKNNPELKAFFSTPRDQDSIGWCYGFAAADMISAEVGAPVSALHASTIFNESGSNFLFKATHNILKRTPMMSFATVQEGGSIGMTINAIVKEGKICSEGQLPFNTTYSEQTYSTISALEKIKSNHVKNSTSFESMCRELSFYTGTHTLLSGIDPVKLGHSILNQDINSALKKLADEKCGKDLIQIPDLKVKRLTKMRTSQKKFFGIVNSMLEKGKPIGMMYNASNITDLGAGLHVSVVTARRWKNDRCEYKVRNSWGETCAPYRSGIECDFLEGSYWLGDEALRDTASVIHYIPE